MWADIIEHEIFHTLGFFHEHERPDRGKHIKVNFENVKQDYHSQYRLMTENSWHDTGHPYDYNSLMHYSSDTFTNGNGPTMIRLDTRKEIQPIARELKLTKF